MDLNNLQKLPRRALWNVGEITLISQCAWDSANRRDVSAVRWAVF